MEPQNPRMDCGRLIDSQLLGNVMQMDILNRIRDSFAYRTKLIAQIRRTKKLHPALTVTVFGSCRQDSISRNFQMTPIRDGLTYPHYTKEIIQAIVYCKSGGLKGPNDHRVFRNHLLNIKASSAKTLKKAFDSTNVFVVEIASRLEYRKNGDYYHHIAVDQIDEIEVRQQPLNELREDMQTIVNLLHPKTVIFSTHYATKESGKRYELIQEIIKNCKELGLSYVNPSDMNEVWNHELIHEEEDIISHFSEFGHQIMADRYREAILLTQRNLCDGALVQSYQTGIIYKDYHGLGDFIFGALRTHQEAYSWNRLPLVDLSNHPMKHFFKSNQLKFTGSVVPIVEEINSSKFQNSRLIFTHLRPLRSITPANIDFVLRHAFNPTVDFRNKISRYFSDLNLQNKSYMVFHLRFGDEFLNQDTSKSEYKLANYADALRKFIQNLSLAQDCIIASDSDFFMSTMQGYGFKILSGKVVHLGIENEDLEGVQDTLLQFTVLMRASTIYQFSNYGWGSGFSETASILGVVQLKKFSYNPSEKFFYNSF